jgi:cysteine-rich secretory family protein
MTLLARNSALRFSRRVCAIVSLLSFALLFGSVRAQSPNAVNDLFSRINRERVSRGLVPYAMNAKLSGAAQTHANDIAHTGRFSHTGSDGSTVFDRVARVGYGAYSWGRRLGENWAWFHDPQTAMQMWMGSTPHRNNILHAAYREIGIGIAAPDRGGFVYVVDFGVEPNVLPVFIQDGASETGTRQIVLRLSNEDYAVSGDGDGTIGKATQVEISSSSDFAGAQWQPFAAKFAWTLTSGDGTKTLYVKYRDARGRTVTSSDSINAELQLAQDLSPTPKPSPKPSSTSTRPRPTATRSLPTLTATPSTPEAGTAVKMTVTPSEAAQATETATETIDTMLISESTPTPTFVSVALRANQTPEGMIDSQDEIPSIKDQPQSADASNEVAPASQAAPIALAIFGMALMLGVLAFVKWLEHRVDHEKPKT